MNLLIDIGNTRAKWAIYQKGQCIVPSTVEQIDDIPWQSVQHTIVCHTGSLDHPLLSKAVEQLKYIILLDHQTNIPFTNLYKSPKTLGTDRVALVAGAQAIYPEQACLVIDTGTCMTYDFIDAQARYIGGNISPGLDMRLRAMHLLTDKLPLVDPQYHAQLLGSTTTEAIQNGALHGLIYEIEGLIKRLELRYVNFKTILTGGNADYLSDYIKSDIFVHSDLLMVGLNKILELNAA